MKVTLINTSDAGGGAPAACLRLFKALKGEKINVKLLVEYKKTSEDNVQGIVRNIWTRLKAKLLSWQSSNQMNQGSDNLVQTFPK